jgi:DNA-binding transcriptional ArsR family regulator
MWKKLGRGWLAAWLRLLRNAESLRLHNMHYAPHGCLSAKSLEALRILQREPRGAIGIDVVAKSDGLLSRSSIYVVLGDLEEQGLVRAKRVRTSGRMPRPRYSITARGLSVLTESELQGSIAEPAAR